jgi:hypothetical protein
MHGTIRELRGKRRDRRMRHFGNHGKVTEKEKVIIISNAAQK